MKWHNIMDGIIDNHRMRVSLIGCGGTGSHVLTNLAMINEGLKHHGRSELHVSVWDPDIVSEYNVGRQVFAPSDISKNKAEVMINRINRFYGYSWDALTREWDSEQTVGSIIISAVDTVAPRVAIHDFVSSSNRTNYWIDIGNGAHKGQIMLGARKNKKAILPTFVDQFGRDVPETPEEPSCSAIESLSKQDMFINKHMATLATNMLWTLLINFRIHYRGIFTNLETLETNPLLL